MKRYKITLEVSKLFDGNTIIKQIEDEIKEIGWKIERYVDFKKVEE